MWLGIVQRFLFSLFFFLSIRLLNVLEVIAPFKHFDKLKEFVSMKLPPGFPVRVGKTQLQPYFKVNKARKTGKRNKQPNKKVEKTDKQN